MAGECRWAKNVPSWEPREWKAEIGMVESDGRDEDVVGWSCGFIGVLDSNVGEGGRSWPGLWPPRSEKMSLRLGRGPRSERTSTLASLS